jgi:hypothetical protein
MTSAGSAEAVVGDHSACSTVRTRGSMRRASASVISSTGGHAAAMELSQAGELARSLRHHQLAALVERQAAAGAVGAHGAVAVAAEARLQTVGAVIEARVQHAAVAAAGVLAGGGLLLQHDDGRAGEALAQLERDGQADDAGADDEVIGGHGIITASQVRTGPPA